MRKLIISLTICFGFTLVWAQEPAESGFIINLNTDIGVCGSIGEFITGTDFGDQFFNDASYFRETPGGGVVMAKRISLELGYNIEDIVEILAGVSYAERANSFEYVKNRAASNFLITSNYSLIEFGLHFKHLIFNPFYYRIGITYGHLVESSSYYVYNEEVVKAPYEFIEAPITIVPEIGVDIPLGGNSSLETALRVGYDLNDIFPYTSFYSFHHLIDITIKLGLKVKI